MGCHLLAWSQIAEPRLKKMRLREIIDESLSAFPPAFDLYVEGDTIGRTKADIPNIYMDSSVPTLTE